MHVLATILADLRVAAQIAAWVKNHFRSRTVGGLIVYDLTKPRS